MDGAVELLGGRIGLVTGGAQGIGAGICEGLTRAGAAVAIVDRQIDKAQALAMRLTVMSGRAIAVCADIAIEEECQAAVAEVVDTFGGLDILVNNAAPGRNREMLGKIAAADWTLHEQVVLQAVAHLVDAALPYLANTGRGAIVNISSVVATSTSVDHCSWPYHVSKAGLNQLTRWLASRLGAHGIRVNAVAPGLIDRDSGPKLTDNRINSHIIKAVVPLGRAGSAGDVANAVVFFCSDLSSYATGQILEIDGGLELAEVFGASLQVCNILQASMQNIGESPWMNP